MGSIPYQTAESATSFLGIGTANYVLKSDGSVPGWAIPTIWPSDVGSSSSTFYPVMSQDVGSNQTPYIDKTATPFSYAPSSGTLTVPSAISCNSTTFDLLNATATTINFGGAATAISIGKSDATGRLTLNSTRNLAITASGTTILGTTAAVEIKGGIIVDKESLFNDKIRATRYCGISGSSDTSPPQFAGGAAGSIPYQTAESTTAFLGIGAANYVLTVKADGTAPVWSAPAPGTATMATNLSGSVVYSIPYQSGSGTTSYITNGSAGQVLTATSNGAPSWSANFAGNAATATAATAATNLSGTTTYSIPYQSSSGTTSYISNGTTGQVLTATSNAAPSWTNATEANTTSAIVKRDAAGNFSAGTITATLSGNAATATTATTATNLSGTTTYSIPYQSASATTTFLSPGTSGYVLTTGGTNAVPSWTNATEANTGSAIVKRDANGDFSARTITANLIGTATSCSGNAATASAITTNSINSDTTCYLVMTNTTAGSGKTLYVDDTTGLLSYNPFTGLLTSTSFNASSDYRIKENQKILDDEFNVDKLRPITYTNKITKKQDIGFIAHEVQELFPYLVKGEKDGEQMQSLNYIGLIGVLVKEIQELKKRVSSLENK